MSKNNPITKLFKNSERLPKNLRALLYQYFLIGIDPHRSCYKLTQSECCLLQAQNIKKLLKSKKRISTKKLAKDIEFFNSVIVGFYDARDGFYHKATKGSDLFYRYPKVPVIFRLAHFFEVVYYNLRK